MKNLGYITVFILISYIGLSQTSYILSFGLSSPIGEYKELNKNLTTGNATYGTNTSLSIEQNIYKGFGIKGMFSFSANPKQEDKIKELYQVNSDMIYSVSAMSYKAYSPYLGILYSGTIKENFNLGIDISYMFSRASFSDITYLGNEPGYKMTSDVMRYQVFNTNIFLKYSLI